MIRLEGLNYTGKGGKVILDDIFCAFRASKLTAILGANGAGKSTLFKCINGEAKYQKGTIYWDNQPIQQFKNEQLSKQKAILRQHYQVSLPFTAREIIEMGRYAYFKSILTPRCQEVIALISELVGVTHLWDNSYLSLSGGEQQRVQLARVLTQIWDAPTSDRLLLLDEPVSALDIQYQHQLMQIMVQLTQQHGFTVVAIVHDLNLTVQYADDVMLMKQGQVHAMGTVNEVLTQEHIRQVFNVDVHIHGTQALDAYIQVQPQKIALINL